MSRWCLAVDFVTTSSHFKFRRISKASAISGLNFPGGRALDKEHFRWKLFSSFWSSSDGIRVVPATCISYLVASEAVCDALFCLLEVYLESCPNRSK